MRWRTSSKIFPAISACEGVRLSESKKSRAPVTVRAETSQIFLSLIKTARASARRRWPRQSGQVA